MSIQEGIACLPSLTRKSISHVKTCLECGGRVEVSGVAFSGGTHQEDARVRVMCVCVFTSGVGKFGCQLFCDYVPQSSATPQ